MMILGRPGAGTSGKVRNNDELCIENEELCIKNEELCITGLRTNPIMNWSPAESSYFDSVNAVWNMFSAKFVIPRLLKKSVLCINQAILHSKMRLSFPLKMSIWGDQVRHERGFRALVKGCHFLLRVRLYVTRRSFNSI